MSSVTAYVVPDNGRTRVSADMTGALERAASALERAGARSLPRRIPRLAHSLDIWSSMMHLAGGSSFKCLLGQGRPIAPFKHLFLSMAGRSPHTLPAIGLALLESLEGLMPRRAARYYRVGLELRQELSELLGTDSVLLYPSYPTPAPKHHRPLFPPFKWVYTAIFNAVELPVTQVPMGLNEEGIPVGLQVVGGPGSDHVCVAVALALEQAAGGWRAQGSFRA